MLASHKQSVEDKFKQLFKQIKLLDFQSSESMNAIKVYRNMLQNSQEYYKETCGIINEKAQEAEKILHNQIFSQTMMENLINDLLDLAKLENN